MTSQYRHRRTSSPSTAFPNPLEPGEIAVNTANRQLAVGDAQSGVLGTPLPFLAVRIFDSRGIYGFNDLVVIGGNIQRALVPNGPGGFNQTQWQPIAGTTDPQYVQKSGDTMTGMLLLPATVPSTGNHATNKTYVDSQIASNVSAAIGTLPALYVDVAGDTMTGKLTLSADPTNPMEAATKQYADNTNPVPSSSLPLSSAGTGNIGTSLKYAREDHVHPAGGSGSAIYVQDNPPAGVSDNSLWFESDTGLMYVRYNDGSSSQWVVVPPSVNVTGIGAVSFNPQTLTVAQQMQAAANIAAVQYIPQSLTADNPPTGKGQASLARQNIYAAPFDAMAYNGLQVNGGCEIDQQFGGANGIAPNATNYYPADNWWLANSSGISINSGQYVMPAVGSFGFKTGIVVNNGATNTTLTGSAFLRLFNTIEGYRIRRLRWGTTEAQPVTISFAAMAGSATTFSVTVSNIDGSRYYTDTFTIAVGNVFQWFTLTIPGCTDGTWNATNGIGFAVGFVISAGPSTAMAPAAVKTWQASPGNLIVAPGSSPANFFSTANAFYVTGLTVLPGLEAPSAARASLVMRPYDQELVACRRYWQSSYNLGTAPGTANQQTYILMQATGNGQTLVGNYVYSTPMRAMPTISIFGYAGGPNGWSDLGGVDRSAGSINSISTLGFSAGTANTALTVGQWYLTNFVANARL